LPTIHTHTKSKGSGIEPIKVASFRLKTARPATLANIRAKSKDTKLDFRAGEKQSTAASNLYPTKNEPSEAIEIVKAARRRYVPTTRTWGK
jgi:hypothetical protein